MDKKVVKKGEQFVPCHAKGCPTRRIYQLSPLVNYLNCNRHFACSPSCASSPCVLCVCDRCERSCYWPQTLKSFSCGCSYHESCVPEGSEVFICGWCEPLPQNQNKTDLHDSVYLEEDDHNPQNDADGSSGWWITSLWKGKKKEVPYKPPDKPTLSSAKMFKHQWTAFDLVEKRKYRGKVITDAKIPWTDLKPLSFTPVTFRMLQAPVREIMKLYSSYMSETDLDWYYERYPGMTLDDVLTGLIKFVDSNAGRADPLRNYNIMNNLRVRVSSALFFRICINTDLLAYVNDPTLWINTYGEQVQIFLGKRNALEE